MVRASDQKVARGRQRAGTVHPLRLGELWFVLTPPRTSFPSALPPRQITDALRHVPACLDYMSRLREPAVFRFCAIPQVRRQPSAPVGLGPAAV